MIKGLKCIYPFMVAWMNELKPKICSMCKIRPSVYERVNHCKECHKKYNRKNYLKHNRLHKRQRR